MEPSSILDHGGLLAKYAIVSVHCLTSCWRFTEWTASGTWADSFTKLYLFGLVEYRRLIYFDSDGLLLKNMDHLFELADVDLALRK